MRIIESWGADPRLARLDFANLLSEGEGAEGLSVGWELSARVEAL